MVTIRCGDSTFPNIKAVVFDKDGTLADSRTFLRQLGQRRSRLIDAKIPGVDQPLLMAFGIEDNRLNPAGLMATGTRQESQIAAAAYIAETGRGWAEAMAIAQSAFEEAEPANERKALQTPIFEGAKELMKTLNAHSLKQGILSSDITAHVIDFVQCYDLESLVEVAMGTDLPPAKPDPTLLHHMSQKLEINPESILVIGDSAVDIQMAHRAGVGGCIGVTWGWSNASDLADAKAIAHQFSDIQVVHP
ncbi:MAG: HAD family hydrolase [Elainellaceae cyanobacterium]